MTDPTTTVGDGLPRLDLPEGWTLQQTCDACPEQYDAYFDRVQLGYLRLRWGRFTVDYPDACGECVYEHDWPGDGLKGCFDTMEERTEHLRAAVEALCRHHLAQRGQDDVRS